MRPRTLVPRFIAVVFCAVPICASAQDEEKKPSAGADVVTVDLKARTFSGTLPFDQKFSLRGAVDSATHALVVRYGLRTEGDANAFAGIPWCAVWVRQAPLEHARARESNFVVEIPTLRLRDSRDYLFEFSLYELDRSGSLNQPSNKTACFQKQDIDALYQGPAADVRLTDLVNIRGDTDIEFTQRFDTDVGIVGAPAAGYLGASSGVHFYFVRPINKKLDLAELKWYNSFSRRLSLYGGLALNELGGGDDVKPAWGVGSPMLGFGIRAPLYWHENPRFGWALRPMRLNIGVIWFKQDDPNPLVDDTSFKLTGFWSATADVDLTAILGPFAALLSPK